MDSLCFGLLRFFRLPPSRKGTKSEPFYHYQSKPTWWYGRWYGSRTFAATQPLAVMREIARGDS